MPRRWTATVMLGILALAACGRPSPTASGQDDPTPRVSSPADDPSPEESHQGDAGNFERAADAAPDFTVTTFDGDRFTLAERTGMPVVINFFDSW